MKFALALLAVVAAEEKTEAKADGAECAKNDECDKAKESKCCGYSSDDEAVQKLITDAGTKKVCVAKGAGQEAKTKFGETEVAIACTDGAKALAATAVAALAIFANM